MAKTSLGPDMTVAQPDERGDLAANLVELAR